MKKRTQWMIYTKRADFNALSARFSVSPVLARIMTNRGITPEEMGTYLNGTLSDIPDPHLMPDIDRAADILLRKRESGARVRIIGDYDIDGICASYVLCRGFRRLGMHADYAIPDRVRDGYGINLRLIEEASADGIDTIVTCDNGIAAVEEIRRAEELGLTVVVTDHHEVGHNPDGSEKLPPADAVVDPKRAGSRYPFPSVCGAVTAWKLIGVLYERCRIPEEEFRAFLPFAAIATVGDVMPLREENRIIVREGLRAIPSCGCVGLQKLIGLCGLDPAHLTAYHIGFVIGPCLNAGGRLESALVGLGMFLEEDPEKAERAALHLKELNDERKKMTNSGVAEAVLQAEQAAADQSVLVVYLPDCHESVAGIIAGKLREKYYRPCIVLTDSADSDLVKGSGRSIEGYHMFRALEEVSDLLVKFGGHPMAAGLTMRRENVEAFRQRLNYNAHLTESDLTEKTWIDLALPFSFASEELIGEISGLAPFGQGNERPVFAQRNAEIVSYRILGKNRNVIKLTLRGEDGARMQAVSFGDAEEWLLAKGSRDHMDVLYYPEIDDYAGRRMVQAVISGWRFRD